jgi:hypothetical protein
MFVVYYGAYSFLFGERNAAEIGKLKPDWSLPGITGCLWFVPGTVEC